MTFENSEIIKLIPPILRKETLLENIVCTRPMREGKFNIGAARVSGKTIINCYGHGGAGFSIGFGSIEKAISLLENEPDSKKKPIRVIGAGCIGLIAAIELSRKGFVVSGITAKEIYDLASWRAGGYFALVSLKTSPEEQGNVDEMGILTFKTCQTIEKGLHPYLDKHFVRYMPVYCSQDTDHGLDVLEQRGVIPKKRDVTLDFGNGVVHPNFHEYMTYFMDTSLFMKRFHEELAHLHIPMEIREISSFDEVEEEIVFNAAGLGSRDLCQDQDLIPVRGHLVTLTPSSGKSHMDYMIFSKFYQDGKNETLYLFPKTSSVCSEHKKGVACHGVLGGTYISHADLLSKEELERLDALEFKKLLDRNSLFYYGAPFEEIDQSFQTGTVFS
ncbi:MAG: FAD-dependent oxidoreductase [Chlamydiae bacterium]|nr:FAD-dependent oxidoreductase [Chlamydiota bacterium]